ncbi:MAG: hypothetical protein AAFN09_00480 [Pseudomonadota bacterium]
MPVPEPGRSGSRFLYAPFDAAAARIDANERVLEERWIALTFRLEQIEAGLQRLEKRLWFAVFAVISAILAQAAMNVLSLGTL